MSIGPHVRLPLRVLLLLGVLLVRGPAHASADWRTPPPGEGPDQAPVRRLGGTPYVAVNDLARLIEATKFWRADLQRLVLRAGPRTLTFVADGPFAVVNGHTVWLGAPVRSVQGEFQIPAALIDSMAADTTLPRLIHDASRGRIVVLPSSGNVGTPRVIAGEAATRLVFPAMRPDQAVVVARSREHFRVRFGGLFTGELPDSFARASLVRGVRPIATSGGSAFECVVSPEANGFRLISDGAGEIALEFLRTAGEGEAFAPEDPPGPRALHVVVIDPGHGGGDDGVTVGGAREKDLTLALALKLRGELAAALPGTRVVLTRVSDLEVPTDVRAEIANRAHADLVLSLHFDGFASDAAHGATAYCPPATVSAVVASRGPARGPARGAARVAAAPAAVELLPWREVAARHGVQSRALAEAVLSALELGGQGPTRLREVLPFELLGVNAPGVLLECATLTAPADRVRVTQEQGLRSLARSLARGLSAYQRHQ